jgi:hypothetical protein
VIGGDSADGARYSSGEAAPDTGAPEDPPTGYKIVLPPEWRKIPLRDGTDEAVKKTIKDTFARLPRNVPRDKTTPYRIELKRRLANIVAGARSRAAIDLYLPVEMMHGAPVAASFLVSEVSFGSVNAMNPALLVSHLASENDDSQPVTLDGALGVRVERTAPPDPSQGIDHGSRRVTYMLSVPADPDRWLEIVFSTLGGGDPDDDYARLLVLLFDAIMATFRWTRV